MITTISLILSLTLLNPSTGAIIRKKSAAKYGHEEGSEEYQRLHDLVGHYGNDDSSDPHHLESTLDNLDSTSKHSKKSHVSGRYSHFEDTRSLEEDDFIYSIVKAQTGEIQLAKFNDEFQDYRDNVVLLKESDNTHKLKGIIAVLLSNAADRKPILRGNSDVTLNEMITNFETITKQAVKLFKNNVQGNGNVNDILKFLPEVEKAAVKAIHASFHNKKLGEKALTPQAIEKEIRNILYGTVGYIIKPSSDKDQNIIYVPKALYKYIMNARELVHG